jgi:lysophospholipase L1-like esterase|tara:strand:- start:1591 stop:2688 length:1098 start_codon:yes stop_codon:yes gene_type:complete
MINFVQILIIVFLLELLARLFIYFRHGKFKFFAPEREKIIKYLSYQSHPYIGYCKSPNIRNSKFPSNDKGFAGKKNFSVKKNKNTIRLMICGGSTVEQNDIDQTKPFDEDVTWPKVLENELNKKKGKIFEVINAGCAGYTILESTVHMLTKGIHYNLDYAILYTSINDAWDIQATKGFKEDYSHARRHPNFPKLTWRLPKWLPNLRFFFLYQYAIIAADRYLSPPSDNLKHYISPIRKIIHDYSEIEKAIKTYENYIKSFCGICISNKIKAILIPWAFNESLISKKTLKIFGEWNKENFVNLLNLNNECMRKVAANIDGVTLLELPKFSDDCFRSVDWIHFSKNGIHKMGKAVADSLSDKMNISL